MSTTTRPGAPADRARRLAGALLRYRAMAWLTGALLLLVTVNVVWHYVLDREPLFGSWLAITHGWVYIAYLATVVDLWSQLRWRLGRLVALVLAGVVPLLSFVVERRVVAEVRDRVR